MTPAAAKIKLWREKPPVFVRDVFGITPDAWQDDALEAFPHTPRLALQSCAGPGKTALLAWLGYNFLTTRAHPKVGAASVSGANLKANLWSELAYWRSKSPLLTNEFELTNTEIYHRQNRATWKIEARTWAKDADARQIGDALRGLHGPYVMWLLDETGSYPESILPVCENIFAGSPIEAHIVQAGNPTSLSGALYRACVRAKHLWKVIAITADPDDPKRTPRVSVEHAREMIAQYGRDDPWMLVNIFGQFPPASFNALIGPAEVEAAMHRVYREADIERSPRVLGVDVAGDGADASVIFPRQGLVAFKPHVMRGVNSVQGAGQVARTWQDWDVNACFIDNTGGFGAGWADQLELLGRHPIRVGFAENAEDQTRYYRRRTEMYFRLVQWIKNGGGLPDVPELVGELSETTYTFKGDALLLEDKALVKAKIGRSPDRADALCLVAGTSIATPSGSMPIEVLQQGDEVLTPFGTARVHLRWESDVDHITTATFSDGSILKGRPAHEVFVFKAGNVRLDALPLTFEVSRLSERLSWMCASGLFTKARSIGFKRLVATSARDSLSSASACCIGAYGRKRTGRFLRDGMSIIGMEIGATIRSTIWRPCLRTIMPRSIMTNGYEWAESAAYPILLANEPPHGIVPQTEGRGTVRTVSRVGRGESQYRLPASAAENLLRDTLPAALASVPWRANRRSLIGDTRQTLGRVLGAATRLWQTVTERQRAVPVSVETESVGPTRVYNLTLDRDNAYYANGILVFNCLTFAAPVAPRGGELKLPRARESDDWDPYARFYERN